MGDVLRRKYTENPYETIQESSVMYTRTYPSQRYLNTNRNQFAIERDVLYVVC